MTIISSHPDNDDMRHFSFARQTHLPIGYFGRRPARWPWLVLACVLLVALGCV